MPPKTKDNGNGSKDAPSPVSLQPVSNVQWISADLLTANGYNPNHVAPPEMELLKISILKSGWTQPIVCRPDYQIVDGFHRMMLVRFNKEVRALTGGLAPVVILKEETEDEQIMATVRHNRARGSHHVLKMADIVHSLIDDHGRPMEYVKELLGMDQEEVERLYDNSGMINRGSKDDFNRGVGACVIGEPKGTIPLTTGRGVVQGPARVQAKVRQVRALELRIAGFRYDDIADELGYRSKGAAFKAVETALRNTLREAADKLRNVESLRIDSMIRTIYPAALKGSFQAVDRTLKLMERKARLLGLDAPAEVKHSGTSDSGGMEITVRRVITTDPAIAGAVVGEGKTGLPGDVSDNGD